MRPTRLVLAILALSSPALAQHSGLQPRNPIGPAKPVTPPASTPAPAQDSLAGPRVEEAPQTSIVELDATGRLIRPDAGPEVAAYRKLELTDEQRAPVEAVLARRAASFDTLVRDNIELLTQLQSARLAGDAETYRKTYMDLQRAFRPVLEAGPLRAQIAAALPAEHAPDYEATLRQYWRAVYDDAVKNENAPSPTGSSHQAGSAVMTDVLRRESVINFGREIDASFQRLTAQLSDRLEAISKELELTGDEESRVTAMVNEYIVKTKLKPTSEERAEFFRRLFADLTPEQRKKLAAMSETRAPARDESPAATPAPQP